MAGKVTPVPEGFHTTTPHLVVKGAGKAIDFYKKAFGAEECYRMNGPDGDSVVHASIQIGDSMIMLGEEYPEMNVKSPSSLGGSPVTVHLYVDDADRMFEKAIDAGAEEIYPLENAFWGDRYGKVRDPFGHIWSIASRVEELSPEEMEKRAAEWFEKNS